MIVYVNAKSIRKRSRIAVCPYELNYQPATLRELIAMMVTEGVQIHNRRLQQTSDSRILSEDEIDALSQIGKIGFGIPFGSREADLEESVEAAIQGFADGLYRIFIGEQEIETLDAPLHLQEGDTITIIRLVMLTGGYF